MAAKKKLSRDQKRALKKAKRTPPPRGAQALLPSPSLLQPLHNAGWDNYTVLHNLPQTEKMSEVLWEFLAPYTPLAPDREAMEKLLAMAIVAWNVTLFPVGERAQRLRELSTTLPAEARTDFLALIREMVARKERDFAQNTRYILNYELNLLYVPLTIPLVCCHINSFRRASSCGEAMARRRKEDRRAGIAARGI
jgi:hypothetical protein